MPITPPSSAMLMHNKLENCQSFGLNAKKAWYIAPCFDQY